MQKNIHAVLIFANEPELRSLSTKGVELANEGRGGHRASREGGYETHWNKEGEKLDPDRIGGEVVAREAESVRG